MKKLLFILAVVLIGCSAEDKQPETQSTCYKIVARGFDERGDYIIVKYGNYNNKRYKVNNYLDYLNQTEICEPINLTEQTL